MAPNRFQRIRTTLRKPLEDHSPLGLGIAGILAFVLVVAVVLAFAAADIGSTTYRAQFAQAASLQAGDKVTVAGVGVGKVDKLELAGDHVVVTLSVDDDVPLGADTTAAIKLTTLLGSRYLELSPAGSGSIADHTISLDHTTVPYNLQDTLQNATTTFDAVDADQIAASMTTLTQQLAGAPALIPQALRNIANLSGIIADRRDQIGSLVTSTAQVTQVLRQQQAALGALMGQGADLLGQLAARRDAIARLLTATTTLVDQLHQIVAVDQPAVDTLLADLESVTGLLAHKDELFRNILQIAPVTIRNLTNSFGSGNALDAAVPGGPFIDSWMCALSGRAEQLNLPQYLQDCQ